MSDRAARLSLAVVTLGLALALLAVDLPTVSHREFWSDGATYYGMTWSLVSDFDLRYDVRDLERVQRDYPLGPQGVFLKRASGGLRIDRSSGFPWVSRVPPETKRLYYAKAFAYPVVAAPFVALFGNRGFLLTNAVFLALALFLGLAQARRQTSAGWALALALAIFLGGVAPVYLIWPSPELFNLGVVTAGLIAWRRERPLLSAVLLGIASYSKPTNVLLALPLGLAPLLATGVPFWLRLRESVIRGLVLGATVAGLFGVNAAATGEMNYQGGERKTFYGRLPFSAADATFDNTGSWMTTDHLGPLVEGKDEASQVERTGRPQTAEELRGLFLANLRYFWIGRFGGAVPYFFPVVLAAALFLLIGPRTREGFLALAALISSYLLYIWMIPADWYGGPGTLGNRYFLNLLPLGLFFVPPGRERVVAVAGLLGAAFFIGPILLAPVEHTLRPWQHTLRAPFRLLPIELTELNDLSIFLEPWRKKRRFGDTEGDPHKGWPADPKAYFLYFPDEGTHGKEKALGEEGFWLEGGGEAEVILRALEPVRLMKLSLRAGLVGSETRVRVGSAEEVTTVAPQESRDVAIEPGPGFLYYDSFLYVLRFRSRATGAQTDGRGAFVHIGIEVQRRPARP